MPNRAVSCFTSLDERVHHVKVSETIGRVIQQLAAPLCPSIFVEDEVDLPRFELEGVRTFFYLISRRYECCPGIIPSNKTLNA